MSDRFRSERAMGEEPVPRILAKLALPAMVGMLVNATYNLVDTIFVGQGVGPLGIGGLTVSFPIQILVLAFGQLLGMGGASIVSRRLGAGDRETAYRTVGTAFSTGAILGLTIAALGMIFLKPMLRLFGAGSEILPYATDYMSVILIGVPFFMNAISANNFMRSEGKAMVAMTAMVIGTGLNILLDPIFIFALGLGVRGAAIATVISQISSFIFISFYYVSGRSGLELKRHHFRISGHRLKEIITIGMPSFVRQGAGSVMAAFLNNILGAYGGPIYIAAFGAINRLLMFTLMPIFGVVQGFQPLAGYNYGAGNHDRVRRVVGLSMRVTTIAATISAIAMGFFPRLLLSMFSTSPEFLDAAVPAMRVVVLVMPIIGIQAVGATYFLAIGKALPALILGMARQVLFMFPLLIIVPPIFGLPGVWWSFPAADFSATLVTVLMLRRELKSLPRSDDGRSEESPVSA